MTKYSVFAIIEGFPLDKNLSVNFKIHDKNVEWLFKPFDFKETGDLKLYLIKLIAHTEGKIPYEQIERLLLNSKEKFTEISNTNPLTFLSAKDIEVSYNNFQKFEEEFVVELESFFRLISLITHFPSRLILMISIENEGIINMHLHHGKIVYESLPGYNKKTKKHSFNLSKKDSEFFKKLCVVGAWEQKEFLTSSSNTGGNMTFSNLRRCLHIFKENLRDEGGSFSHNLDVIRNFWTILTILSNDYKYIDDEKIKKQKELNEMIKKFTKNNPELLSQFRENQSAWYSSYFTLKKIGLLFDDYKMKKEFENIKDSWKIRSDWEHNRILVESGKRGYYVKEIEKVVSKLLRKYVDRKYKKITKEKSKELKLTP